MSHTAGASGQCWVQATSKHQPGSKGHSPSWEVAKCSLVIAPRGSPGLGNACPSWLGSPCTQRGWGPLSWMTASRRVRGNTCRPFLPEGQAGPVCRFSWQRDQGSTWGPVQRLQAVQHGSHLPPSAHTSPATEREPGGCRCAGWVGKEQTASGRGTAGWHLMWTTPGEAGRPMSLHTVSCHQPFLKGEG